MLSSKRSASVPLPGAGAHRPAPVGPPAWARQGPTRRREGHGRPLQSVIVWTITYAAVCLPLSSAIQWLAVSQMSSLAAIPHHTSICNNLRGTLVPKQVQFCRENPSFMEAVKLGALEAINECQFQFRTQRWNCSAFGALGASMMADARRNAFGDNIDKESNNEIFPGNNKKYSKKNNNIKDNDVSSGGGSSSSSIINSSTNDNKKVPYAARLKSSSLTRGGEGAKYYDLKQGGSKNSNSGSLLHHYSDATAATPAAARVAADGSNSSVAVFQLSSSAATPNEDEGQGGGDRRNGNKNTNRSSPDRVTMTNGDDVDEDSHSGRSGGRRRRKRRRDKDRVRTPNGKNKKAPSSLVPFPFPVVPRGTREAAFVHAISSAGVAHAITLRCSSGALDDCGCDHSVKGRTVEGFQWSGCSHNIAYGVSLSKRFVDARDKKKVQKEQRALREGTRLPQGRLRRAARALINLHNNEAGRQLIEQDMRVGCKCHGVSGSCELKTCWRQMPAFREVGESLKIKFDSATEVRSKNIGGRLKLVPNKQFFQKLSDSDLVFVSSSPEYCDFDPTGGSLGTHGRVCNKSSRGLDGCDLLCCDRGYTSSLQMVPERCSCKFHWCCFVECQTCVNEVTVHTCN